MMFLRDFTQLQDYYHFYQGLQNWPKDANPLDWNFEGTINAVYETLLTTGDWALDGGACLGRHTIPMAHIIGNMGRIIAVEPNPFLYSELWGRIEDKHVQHAVRVTPVALASERGIASFNVVTDSPGLSSLLDRNFHHKVTKLTVVTETIDHLTRSASTLPFIKLDLEGGEMPALEGAHDTLRRHQPVIALEHTAKGMKLTGIDAAAFFGFFERFGYCLTDIVGTRYTPEIFDYEGWRPWYLIALPVQGNPERATKALEAMRVYTARIYQQHLTEPKS